MRIDLIFRETRPTLGDARRLAAYLLAVTQGMGDDNAPLTESQMTVDSWDGGQPRSQVWDEDLMDAGVMLSEEEEFERAGLAGELGGA